MRDSSQTTDSASAEIKQIIEQQTSSFEQIVITLRQISQAAESFSVSTQTISQSAENLCSISEQLKQIQEDDSEKTEADNDVIFENGVNTNNADNDGNENPSFDSDSQMSDARVLVENSIFSENKNMEV